MHPALGFTLITLSFAALLICCTALSGASPGEESADSLLRWRCYTAIAALVWIGGHVALAASQEISLLAGALFSVLPGLGIALIFFMGKSERDRQMRLWEEELNTNPGRRAEQRQSRRNTLY